MGAITVKFVSNKRVYTSAHVRRQFPAGGSRWGEVEFVFDAACRHYDYLVAYHDIPQPPGSLWLDCPRENTVLVTHEPSAVKCYGSDFAAQFGWLLSCHEEWALPHKNRIAMQPGSQWGYGADWYAPPPPGKYSFDALAAAPPPQKPKLISTVCSAKAMRHTLHQRRLAFTRQLQGELPALEVFGHGVKTILHKAEALDDYRYHLTIENAFCPHYWSEKLADAFLGYTLPLYYGCPNAEAYFPPQSFIRIDINDFAAACDTIKRAIADNEYEKRLPTIIEARRRVLEEHNLYAMLARVIRGLPAGGGGAGGWLHSRRRLLQKKPRLAVRYLLEKYRQRRRLKAGGLG